MGSLTTPTIGTLSGGLAALAGAIVISAAMPAFTAYRRQPADEDQRPAAESAVAIST